MPTKPTQNETTPATKNDEQINNTTEQAMATAPTPEQNIAARTADANRTIRTSMLATMGAGLVPLPVVDFLAFTGIQLTMINKLAGQYGIPFRKELGKAALGSLVSSAAPMLAAPFLGRGLLKLIPGIGSFAGMISTSLLGGALTYAVGKVFQMHFESGGTLLSFEPEKMRDYFAEQFENGKKIAAEARA